MEYVINQTNGLDHSLKVENNTPPPPLGPILFILFINDFHKAIDFSTVHHFADDINLLLTENTLKKLNKHINRDT